MVTDVVVKAEIYIDNNNDKICTYIYSAKFKIKLAKIPFFCKLGSFLSRKKYFATLDKHNKPLITIF